MSLAVAAPEHFVLHASDHMTVTALMLLALEIILVAVLYLTIMAVLARTMLGEALRLIRLALGRAGVSQAQGCRWSTGLCRARSAARAH
jgi:hypothetical protein